MEYNIYGQETASRRCSGFIHEIRKGDTLYGLGKKYNVKVSAIIFANPYVNVYHLQIGDEICIPKARPIIIPRPFMSENEEEETGAEDQAGVESEINEKSNTVD